MRWLHLSDLHVGAKNPAQETALRDLVGAVNRYALEKPFDLVILTGDLAYSGLESEYQLFNDLVIKQLRNLTVSKNARFIAVPGNHDLNCEISHPLVWAALGKRRQELFFENTQDGVSIRSSRAKAFSAYEEFLRYAEILGCSPLIQSGNLIPIQTNSGKCVNFTCLVTAYFSDKDNSDKQQAPAPTPILRQLLQNIENSDQIFVLGHHPLHWFSRESLAHFKTLLIDHNAIYLHGHEHQIQSLFGKKGLYSLGFGAAYQSVLDNYQDNNNYRNTFAICELNSSLSVRFISWDNESGSWVPDTRVPPEIRSSENLESDTFTILLPSSSVIDSSEQRFQFQISRTAKIKPKINSPLWLEGDEKTGWIKLLEQLGLLKNVKEIYDIRPTQGQSRYVEFVAQDDKGKHLICATSALSSIITFDQVQYINTLLDTESLDTCVIITFGTLADDASALADRLKNKKEISVLDGEEIAATIEHFPMVDEIFNLDHFHKCQLVITPLIVSEGLAYLVQDIASNSWFCIIDPNGKILLESNELVYKLREFMPEYRSLNYLNRLTDKVPGKVEERPIFNRSEYLNKCSLLFDSVRYAGLAALGLRLPTDSLRKLYVPAAADVSRNQEVNESLLSAVEDFVEALKLDNAQRDQLDMQLRNYYGVGASREAGAARKLYQRYGNILIQGDPGSGKSCFVRYEILEYCQPPDKQNPWYSKHTPILLPLAEAARLIENELDILDVCARNCASQQLNLSRDQLDILLSRGEVAFFFDGIDEVGSLEVRQELLRKIGEIIEKYEGYGNRFVVTSRPAAVHTVHVPEALITITLRGLTDDEIRLLATRIISLGEREESENALKQEDTKVVEQLIQDCQDKPGIRRLARNPLLLTLLVLIYTNSGPMAARRHVIYSQAVKTLVSVRHRTIRARILSEADLRHRLGKLALSIYRGQISEIPSRREVRNTLSKEERPKGDNVKASSTIDNFIQDVAEITGLIVLHPKSNNLDDDVISFMHHSFLEYYASVGFMEEDDYQANASKVALSPRWREVITLMFGLLSEQGDVTEFLRKISEISNDSEFITASRLELALDCALECDVPPERAQVYLSEELANSLRYGPASVIADVRESLAIKTSDLLEVSGSEAIRECLIRGVQSNDSQTVAAYIDFIGKLGGWDEQESSLISVVEESFKRSEQIIRIACISAMQNVPALRTDNNLEELRNSLSRGTTLEKNAALQLLDSEEALISNFSNEVIDLMNKSKPMLASIAARCVIAGGVFSLKEYQGRNLLDRALQIYMRSDRPQKNLSKNISLSMEEVEGWIYSDVEEENILGIRCLAVIERKSDVIYGHIFTVLRNTSNHSVKSACLDALALNTRSIKIATLADTEIVCKCLSEHHGDVRKSAIKALRYFPTIDMVTKELLQRYSGLKESNEIKELDVLVRTLSLHSNKDKKIRDYLQKEMFYELSNRKRKWDEKKTGIVSCLLSVCDQMGGSVDDKYSRLLIEVANDFRVPERIRKLSLQAFGRLSNPTIENGQNLLRVLDGRHEDLRYPSYRALIAYIEKCKGNVSIIRETYTTLEQIKHKLIERWRIESKGVKDRIDYSGMRNIRSSLLALDDILSSYDEFKNRMKADEFALQAQINFESSARE